MAAAILGGSIGQRGLRREWANNRSDHCDGSE
jgi:hypothetical protein